MLNTCFEKKCFFSDARYSALGREKPAKEWQQYATVSTPGTMRLGTNYNGGRFSFFHFSFFVRIDVTEHLRKLRLFLVARRLIPAFN